MTFKRQLNKQHFRMLRKKYSMKMSPRQINVICHNKRNNVD